MTDLHCHILPGIDDGARNPDISIQLLRKELQDGVNQIVLTPHFNCERETVPEFHKKRRRGVMDLAPALSENAIKVDFKLAGEVYFSPELPNLDLKGLCISGTNILLVELPVDYNPGWTRDILFELQMQNYRILLAHVERYPYVLEHPEMLYDLVEAGVYTQVNAADVLHKPRETQALRNIIGANLVHVMATDAHSVHRRPPLMGEGLAQIRHWFGERMEKRMIENADLIFKGQAPRLLGEPRIPKNGFHLFGGL